MRRILVTGARGQVGWELARTLLPLGELLLPDRVALDLSDPPSVGPAVLRLQPDVVVNAAAYTAVDRAESEPDLAHRVNAESPGEIAKACRRLGALLIHYSTDYVFSGTQSRPYRETDATAPCSVYGASKLAGEQAIQAVGGRTLILRTAWVYGTRGKNFLLTMLRLANERDQLRVVADQVGSPTWSRLIAEVTAQILAKLPHDAAPPVSLAHLTSSGSTSWHAFASTIVAEGARMGLCPTPPVSAITTTDFPTPARRPAFSTLDNTGLEAAFGLSMPSWDAVLSLCLEDLAASRPVAGTLR